MTLVKQLISDLRDRAHIDYGKHDLARPDDTMEDTLAWRAADEIARLTADRVKLDNLRHNHDALRKEHDEWKGAVENAAADKAKADALAEAALALADRVDFMFVQECNAVYLALTAWKEGQREVKVA